MALNRFMHPRNRYKDNRPDFAKLAQKYPDFRRHMSVTLSGKVSLDFRDPEALRALTCTLLKEDFGIDLEIPMDRIIPTVPLRLNYILWIEDLLKQSGHAELAEIHGIDIGCGASCIYPLLGAKLNAWHFVASEVDSTAAGYALHNVKKNNLSSYIQVHEACPDDMLCGVTKATSRSLYHFTMCNPPFFGNILEAQGIMTSRSDDRAEPKSVSTASEGEMIWDEGGEVDFIGRMITDSLQLKQQVVWYTSMVGKKASLRPIKQLLARHKIRNVTTTEFCQGRTMRWGIGWTFYNDFEIPVSPSRKRFKRDKERPPLIIHVPEKVVQDALGEMGQESKVTSSTSEEKQKVKAIGKILEKFFADLEIAFTLKSGPKQCLKYTLTATTNTWSNQRRKRRQLKHRLDIDKETASSSKTGIAGPQPELSIELKLGNRNNDGQCGHDTRTIASAHLEPDKERRETSDLTEEAPAVETKLSTPNPREAVDSGVNTSTLPEIGVKYHEDQTGHIEPLEGSRAKPEIGNKNAKEKTGSAMPEYIFRCLMIIKANSGQVVLEMTWVEGQMRESMYQVGQYIKNQLNKM